jgi:hypothetical protein
MATTGSNVTRSIAQTAQYIQEKWTRDIQQPFDKVLAAAKLVQDRSGLVSDGGDIVNIPFAGSVNARAKAASTAITYDSPEGTPVVLNIDKHYYVGVLIEDIAKVQSSYDLQTAFKQRMAEALARQIDTDLMALYASAGTSIAGGAAIDDADILAVVAAFDSSNTPPSERFGIVGHNSKIDLLGINKYNAYDQTGKAGLVTSSRIGDNGGEGSGALDLLGSVYGMEIYHSGNVATSTTGRNIFFHKRAINLAQQRKPEFHMEYSVDQLGWKTALDTIYGVGVERAASVIELTRTTAP